MLAGRNVPLHLLAECRADLPFEMLGEQRDVGAAVGCRCHRGCFRRQEQRFESGADVSAGAMQSVFHGIDAGTEYLGYFGRGQPFDISEYEHIALDWIEHRDRTVKRPPELASDRDLVRWRIRRRRPCGTIVLLERHRAFGRAFRLAVLLDTEAPRHCVELGGNGRRPAKNRALREPRQ
jgi:hypothetical protein